MLRYAVTIFLSAFLLFQVQPLIGKYILPWFGGIPTVWTMCMLFFQVVLLAGYSYAHAVNTWLSQRRQIVVHLVLLGVAAGVLVFAMPPSSGWKPPGGGDPTWRILALLAASVGLPYFMLSTTGPLLQAWFSRSFPGRSPYRLYSLSNVGSLLALVTFPFVVEPQLTLTSSSQVWKAGFVLFALLCAYVGWKMWAQAPAAAEAIPAGSSGNAPDAADIPRAAASRRRDDGRPGIVRRLLWLGLPACGSMLLLAVTHKMCQDVAVVPFLWILPLALYLLTFIICFDNERWYFRPLFWPLYLLLTAAMIWLLWRGVNSSVKLLIEDLQDLCAALVGRFGEDTGWWTVQAPNLLKNVAPFKDWARVGMSIQTQVVGYAAGLFVCCMVCHGELVRIKPSPKYLTSFYLMVSLGGALGGVFVGMVAPHIFQAYLEFHVALWGSLVLGATALWLSRKQQRLAARPSEEPGPPRLEWWRATLAIAGVDATVAYLGLPTWSWYWWAALLPVQIAAVVALTHWLGCCWFRAEAPRLGWRRAALAVLGLEAALSHIRVPDWEWYLSVAMAAVQIAVVIVLARWFWSRRSRAWQTGLLAVACVAVSGVCTLFLGFWAPTLNWFATWGFFAWAVGALLVLILWGGFWSRRLWAGRTAAAPGAGKPKAADVAARWIVFLVVGIAAMALVAWVVLSWAPAEHHAWYKEWRYVIGAAAIAFLIAVWFNLLPGRPGWPAWWARIALPLSLAAIIVLGEFLRDDAERATIIRDDADPSTKAISTVAISRNFYGIMRITEYYKDSPDRRHYQLANGRISHGWQLTSPEGRLEPISYFARTSGVGLTFKHYRNGQPLRVGVLGLGVGTFAAYGEKDDHFTFYEINPECESVSGLADKKMVPRLANPKHLGGKGMPWFTYLTDLRERGGEVDVRLGDGRLTLERELAEGEPQGYDILAMDAFSSDAVPVHLLTMEAFHIYLKHLKHDGVILVNITNRYIDLQPVVDGIAQELNREAKAAGDNGSPWQTVLIEYDGEPPDYMLTLANWMLVTRNAQLVECEGMRSAATKRGLHPQDILLAIDKQEIASVKECRAAFAAVEGHEKVTLKVLHGDKERDFEVVLRGPQIDASKPDEAAGPSGFGPLLGLEVARLSPALREKRQIPENRGGVLITAIEEGSPAAKAVPISHVRLWTDDFSNLYEILRWK